MNKVLLFCLVLLCFLSCSETQEVDHYNEKQIPTPDVPYLVVLGTAQDAGYPQAACKKDCCKPVWNGEREREWVSCIAYVDPQLNQSWMFDATPDFKDQLQYLEVEQQTTLSGIFITHAHMGHYTGLMHLGREAMGAQKIPVYTMPTMSRFLRTNGPWGQLVKLQNIQIKGIQSDSTTFINANFEVTPLQVPHRDEYSETVGYSIQGPNKKALFIPDIDKWELWRYNIDSVIQQHDYAFLDGSFFANGEIPGRDMSEIPHPFVEESLARFAKLPAKDKNKIYFIHFNHTNPILDPASQASKQVEDAGMKVARTGVKIEL